MILLLFASILPVAYAFSSGKIGILVLCFCFLLKRRSSFISVFNIILYYIIYLLDSTSRRLRLKMEIFEGNPVGKRIWDAVWKLPIMQPGKQVYFCYSA